MMTTTKKSGKPHEEPLDKADDAKATKAEKSKKSSEHDYHKSDMRHVARMLRRVLWCDRYIHGLSLICSDKEVADWCKTGFWTKEPSYHAVAGDFVYGKFFHEAYECGMVPKNYSEDVNTIMPQDEVAPYIMNPSPEFLEPLTSRQVLACIGFHFRADHFSNGSLLEERIASFADARIALYHVTQKQ